MAGASAFIGLEIQATTYDNRVIIGVLQNIDTLQGTIELLHAAHNVTNGGKIPLKSPLSLSRADVNKLQILSTAKTPSSTPGADSERSTPRRHAERVNNSASLTNAFAQAPSAEDVYALPSPPQPYTKASPHSHNQPYDYSPAEQAESEIELEDSPKQRKQRGGVRRNRKGKGAGPSEGNEADVSATPYDEPERGSAGTGSSRSRGLREQPSGHHLQKQAFAEEFNFQANLDTFDKAKVFAQIKVSLTVTGLTIVELTSTSQSQDDTDPSLRLVAHNRSRQQAKLAPTENVLSPEELAEQRKELNQSSADETSDYGEEEERAPTKPVERERRATLKPSGNGTGIRRSFKTPSGVHVAAVRLKQFREALSIADIETGPSAIQRTENAGRGIASFILQTLSRDRQLFPLEQRQRPSICVMAGDCQKGAVALRAGAHLSNHGCKVVCYIFSGQQVDGVFRTNLREFSSSGGRTLRDLEDLQSIQFDLLIDAIADNDVQATLGEKTTADLAAATFALQTGVPILSIDSALGTDHDTGAPTTSSPLRPTYVACLGAVRSGCAVGLAEVVLVDIGFSPTLWSRVGVDDWDACTFGADFVVSLQ
ncbi:enhancer of mRNA-decapping protein 3, partial [Phenoliferia sp. Uapishka_3]